MGVMNGITAVPGNDAAHDDATRRKATHGNEAHGIAEHSDDAAHDDAAHGEASYDSTGHGDPTLSDNAQGSGIAHVSGIAHNDASCNHATAISPQNPAHAETPDAGPFTQAWDKASAHHTAAPIRLLPFRPFAPADDLEAWRALPRALTDLYLQRAAEHRERPWPQLLARDWARFFRDGDRSAYESRYGERRRRVTDDLMAYGAANARRKTAPDAHDDARTRALLDDAIDGITLICDESAWQVPAHNAYIRDTPQLPWPDPDRPVLDLFACETGQLLASALYLLGDALPEPLRRRVMRELTRRIVTPYLTDRFWWMGEGDGPTNNWTTWCTQNVLATVFLASFDDTTRAQAVTRATASLDTFLSEYGDDGCCTEGAGYYHSAALCLFGAMRVLADAAPDAFAPLWRAPKIVNIATYIARVRIGEDLYFNFSDCSIHAGLMGAREYLFAQAVGDRAMACTAAIEWTHALDAERKRHTERTDACDAGDTGDTDAATPTVRCLNPMSRISPLSLLFEADAANAMLHDATGDATRDGSHDADRADNETRGRETFFPSTGIAVIRGAGFDAAVKAGRNGFSHSHNDTGSVIVWRAGAPVLIDPGVETYTRQTFSPRRYELWPMQSSWHNLPDFDGVMQRATPDCRAEDVEVSLGGDVSRVAADLTQAWPPEAGLRSYLREVTLDRIGGTLTVTDRVEGDFRVATMHLMTAVEPVRDDMGGHSRGGCDGCDDHDAHGGLDRNGLHTPDAEASATIRIGGSLLVIERPDADAAPGRITVEPKPLDDPKLRAEWRTDRLWRINVPFRSTLRLVIAAR